MADVLLTHSNHLYFDRKQVDKMQPYAPLQTLLAAAELRRNDISVALFDPTLNAPKDGFEKALLGDQPRLAVVCEDDFNFLSKMCLTRNRELAFEMAGTAARHGVPCVAHGSDATDHVREYLNAGFSAVLLGEVETTLLEIAQGHPLHKVRGLAYAGADFVQYNPPRELRSDLDSLPLPAWDLVDIQGYRNTWRHGHGFFSMNMVSSRGCPYRCNWCAKPVYGQKYSVRSARAVAEEMSYLKTAFQPDHIWFADDIFALSPRWTTAFADAVDACDAHLPFKIQSRCDLMTRESVAALRRAGCVEVWMGAESGSQRILDAMDKGIRVGQIYEARENLRRHGMRACFFLQFGYPGELWEDIEQTVCMVRETKPDDVGISVSYPLPGTKFHQVVAGQLGTKANWANSGELAMMFRGTYPTEVYRALADALHVEVRGQGDVTAAWARVNQLERTARCAFEVAS